MRITKKLLVDNNGEQKHHEESVMPQFSKMSLTQTPGSQFLYLQWPMNDNENETGRTLTVNTMNFQL